MTAAGAGARRALRTLGALAFLVLVQRVALLPYRPPPVVPSTAPTTEFSGERAMAELRGLMPEPEPRPTGSVGSARFRERLVRRLDEVGAAVSTQEANRCAESCSLVTNVVAVIPGASTRSVVLMAHYDAFGDSPGAGDNGASVAALLELARNVVAAGRPPKTLVLVFTDGEEVGALGAAAFLEEHPLARTADLVVNLDGSGSSGPSRLLRVGPRSGALVAGYAEHARYPLANSIRHSLFERYGTGSDFGRVLDVGLPGLDFTFMGSRWTQHTPADRLEVLDPRTVQHQGGNAAAALAAAMEIGEGSAAELAYVTLPGGLVLRWPIGWLSWGLVGAAAALLAFASVGRGGSPRQILVALFGLGVVFVLVAAAVRLGLLAANGLAGGRPQWPDPAWPWRALVYGIPALALLAAQLPGAKAPAAAFLASSWALIGAAAATTLLDQRLAAPFVVGALAAGASAGLAGALRWSWPGRLAAAAVLAAVIGVLFFPLAHMAEATRGYAQVSQILWPVLVVLVGALPLIAVAGERPEPA